MADTPNAGAPAAKPQSADDAAKAVRAADAKVIEAQDKAREAEKSDEQKRVDEARNQADDTKAKVAADRASDPNRPPATTAAEAKADVAVFAPDRPIGDHHAQRFANTPANPQLAPGLDPDHENKVKLTMLTSDHPDPDAPMIAYVHPEMVGDYLRAGWSRG